MSGQLVLAILQDEWNKRGSFPVADHYEIARTVQRRVTEIQHGKTQVDREPGSDDQ